MSTDSWSKRKGKASYRNQCYLTNSCRTANQVKIYLCWDDVCFHFWLKAFFLSVQLFTFSPKIILECKNGAYLDLNCGLWAALCSNNSFKSKLRHLIKHFSVNIIMKQLCLVMMSTGQRKFPRPFYIPADDKVIHTIESISYKFAIYTFYMLNGKYRTHVFRSGFFVVKERALASNSYISACHSQCIFWLKRKHCDLILILFFSSSGDEICHCISILYPRVWVHICD